MTLQHVFIFILIDGHLIASCIEIFIKVVLVLSEGVTCYRSEYVFISGICSLII